MTSSTPRWDTLIKNALVYPGNPTVPFRADVAIQGKHIAAIGTLDGKATVTIDATNLALAPGFIDVHSHDDYAVFCNPDMDFKIMQGVTTEIVGNCGFGATPFQIAKTTFQQFYPDAILPPCANYADYVNAINDSPSSINIAFLVGHNTLRSFVMDNAKRKPTQQEMLKMCELLNEGLSAGALGFSSGLFYEPGCYAEKEELISLAKEVAHHGGLYTTHIRNEADQLLDAIEEALCIGERAHIPVQISHHKAQEKQNWGLVKKSLKLLEQARQKGMDVTADQYPYAASCTILSAVLKSDRLNRIDAKDILLCSIPNEPQYDGATLEHVCQEWQLNAEEAAQRILKNGETFVVLNVMSEEDVCTVLQHETTMIGSDGVPSQTGNPHPRLYGTFPRILGHYVREKNLLSLSEAIYRMTGMPATKFKIKNRGFIKENYYADLVLFNPNTIIDTATYSTPRQYPVGIEYVFVNGSPVVKQGHHTHQRPGMVVGK